MSTSQDAPSEDGEVESLADAHAKFLHGLDSEAARMRVFAETELLRQVPDEVMQRDQFLASESWEELQRRKDYESRLKHKDSVGEGDARERALLKMMAAKQLSRGGSAFTSFEELKARSGSGELLISREGMKALGTIIAATAMFAGRSGLISLSGAMLGLALGIGLLLGVGAKKS